MFWLLRFRYYIPGNKNLLFFQRIVRRNTILNIVCTVANSNRVLAIQAIVFMFFITSCRDAQCGDRKK